MDITLNIIPPPIPNICESAHERLIPPIPTYEEQPRLFQQPKITIIRLPCNNSHDQVSGTAHPKANSQNDVETAPVVSCLEKPTDARTSTNNPVSFPHKRFPATKKSPPPLTTTSPPQLPSKIPIPSNKASKVATNPHNLRKGKVTNIPSNSSMSSFVSNTSTTKPTIPCPTPSTARKSQMSEHAAQTVRVMDWAISLVKQAEKRVREEERATHEKEAFVLRLRRWEAEMKIRKMEENAEEEKRDEEAHSEEGCLTRKIFWSREEPRMGRFKSMLRDAQQQSWRGVAVVLER